MKKKHKNNENSEEESEEDEPMIKVEENRVYFHADVTRENCFKLIESIQKAQEYIAIRKSDSVLQGSTIKKMHSENQMSPQK